MYVTNSCTHKAPSYYMDIPGKGKEISTIVKIAGAWKDTITDKDMKQFKLHGYVAYPVDKRLVVITLNTAVYSIYHEPQSLNLDDPLGQFKWLKDELKEMKRSNRVAFLCGHIPPSLDSHVEENQWKVEYIEMYKEIIKDYSDIIRAQLFGHLHRNEVRFSPDGNLPPLFITTALSPRYNNNPAFIVWEYDPTSYELCDFVLHVQISMIKSHITIGRLYFALQSKSIIIVITGLRDNSWSFL